MRKLRIINYFCLSLVMVIGLITIVASGGGDGGGSDTSVDDTIDPYEIDPSTIETFDYDGGNICMEDGKPVIRMFSTSTCPLTAHGPLKHLIPSLKCTWIKD